MLIFANVGGKISLATVFEHSSRHSIHLHFRNKFRANHFREYELFNSIFSNTYTFCSQFLKMYIANCWIISYFHQIILHYHLFPQNNRFVLHRIFEHVRSLTCFSFLESSICKIRYLKYLFSAIQSTCKKNKSCMHIK